VAQQTQNHTLLHLLLRLSLSLFQFTGFAEKVNEEEEDMIKP
jgi:hypothetical protein